MQIYHKSATVATFLTPLTMAAPASLSYTQLLQDVRKNKLAPIYILHGEEGYFIDRLVEQIENLIPEADSDFNHYTL